MKPEVRALIKQAGLCRSTVEQVAAMLPDDDLELDRWITEAIRDNDSIGAHAVIFAALNQGRPVDARHLSGLALAAESSQQSSVRKMRWAFVRFQNFLSPDSLNRSYASTY